MAASPVTTILTLGVAAGLIAFFAIKFDVQSKQSDLNEAKISTDAARKGLQEKLTALEEAKQKLAALKGAVDSTQSLNKEIQALQAKRQGLLEEFTEVVVAVRTKAVGAPLPELALPDGRTLQGAAIQKVTNSEITFSHSGGVIKVPERDLPQEIKQRYRIGMAPMNGEDLPIQSVSAASPSTTKPGTSAQLPPPAAGSSAQKATRDNADHIRIDIDSLVEKIKGLERSRIGWSERAAALRVQVAGYQGSGKPTYNLFQEIKQAEQNIVSTDQQITQIQAQIVVLRKRLADAINAPVR